MSERGLHFHHDPSDPGEVEVHRAMEAIKKAIFEEYGEQELAPNITIVAVVPPYGRIGVATTEPDASYALEALQLGWGAMHRSLRLHGVEPGEEKLL